MFPMIMQAGAALIGGVMSGMHASRQASRAKARANAAQSAIADIKRTRGAVPDPYANYENLADMATDLSRNMTNPMANLAVATQAAEMQAEEADIALANTLDTIRATGGGAGGATALAQAALQSKKGIAANIEQQEVANERQRLAGEQTLQQQRMAEAQRIQSAEVSGKQFVFNATEQREMQQLNRLSSQIGALRGAAAQARADSTNMMMGAIGAVGDTLGSAFGG